MHFQWMIPLVLFGGLTIYTLISPLIDWVINTPDWTFWGPVCFVLYILWWLSGAKAFFWNEAWQRFAFEEAITRSWFWDLLHELTTPCLKYFEKPSGHAVKLYVDPAQQQIKDEDRRPSEAEIYFLREVNKQGDNVCGYSNFGYCADLSKDAKQSAEQKQETQFYQKELYRYLATDFMGKVDEELIMADLGCGRGAGTIYLSELLKTRQQNGLDFNESLIQYCARGYQYNNLGRKMNWCLVDACALHEEVKAGMLDLIFFVQGLHQVKDPALFFKEIQVTLKPTSRLILADFFFDREGLKQELLGWNLRITKKVDITENVLQALKRSGRKQEKAEIAKHVGYFFKSWAGEEFGLPDSWIYDKLTKKNKDGKYQCSYWAYEIMLDDKKVN